MPTYQFPTIYERLPYKRPPYESPTHERPTRYPNPIIYRPPTRSICDVPLEFEYGQRVHNVVYLERRHRDPYFLSIAAAFETLHRWEHNRRREGQLLNHDSAKVWLEASVVHEAESLFVAAEGHPRERLRMLRFAKLQVIDLYEYQYSEYRCYDPNTQNSHWTMAKEWREPKVDASSSANASLARVVAEEAGKLHDKAYRRDQADPEKCEQMIGFATNHAMDLYDWQYGDDDDVHDDYHEEYAAIMVVNRTIREEWTEHA